MGSKRLSGWQRYLRGERTNTTDAENNGKLEKVAKHVFEKREEGAYFFSTPQLTQDETETFLRTLP